MRLYYNLRCFYEQPMPYCDFDAGLRTFDQENKI